jgi:propanediol dehydratase small subunit
MITSGLAITLLAIAAAIWFARNGAPLPGPFKARTCQGSGWRRAFPKAPKDDIRAFLSLFVEAFAFHASHRLKFNPKDTILSVYRALYPHKWLPDALEVETLAASVEKLYGVKLGEVWSETLTLGELFEISQRASEGRSDA